MASLALVGMHQARVPARSWPERNSSMVRASSSSFGLHQAAQRLQFFHRAVARLHACFERLQPAVDLAQRLVVGKQIEPRCRSGGSRAGRFRRRARWTAAVRDSARAPWSAATSSLVSASNCTERCAMHSRNDEHDAGYTDGDADDGLRPFHSCCFSTPDRTAAAACRTVREMRGRKVSASDDVVPPIAGGRRAASDPSTPESSSYFSIRPGRSDPGSSP